jgi:hypothetical protein
MHGVIFRRHRAASRFIGNSSARRAGSWCRSHSPWARLAQGCCTLLVLCPGGAAAASDAPAQHARDGFSFDLRLAAGGATAAFTESDRPVADFDALALGGSARFGWFTGPHVLLGAEISSSWHSGVGSLRVHDPPYFYEGLPSEASYSVVAPLGVFVEVYPWVDAGWFVALSGGVGFIDLPSFSDGDSNVITSGFSLDVGSELSGSAKRGPAVFVRYSRWAGEEFIVSEHPDGLVSRELLVGLRWSFWTPEWQ